MIKSVRATDRFDQVAHDRIVGSIPEPTLRKRDVELLSLVAAGLTYREIAEHCLSSPEAVRSRVRALRGRFRVRTTVDLLMTAYEQGLVTDQLARGANELLARFIAEQRRKEKERDDVLASIREPRRPTSRQLELIQLIGEGLTNRQIADRLSISVKTVPSLIYRLRLRVRAADRADIVAVARQRGLLSY